MKNPPSKKIIPIRLFFCLFITLIIFFLYLFNAFPVSAEVVIYDNITTSNYKFFIIDDDINIKYLNEYKYDVLINGYSEGLYSKGEKIFYPDNASISIISPDSNINTDISDIWDVGRTNFYIAVMYVGGFLVLILFIWIIIRKRR